MNTRDTHELIEELCKDRKSYLAYLSKRVGDAADREDILQQAYGKAVTNVAQLRDDTRLRGWFQGILRHAVSDFYAARSREQDKHQHFKDNLSELPAHQPAVVTIALAPEGMCHCGEALMKEFPEDTIELLRRVDLGDECPSDVASDLGITANNARVRLHRAHVKLRGILRTHCATESSDYRDFMNCECTGC